MLRWIILLLSSLLLFSGCLFHRPKEIKKEYYPSGNLKLVRKIYKNGERVKYYTDGASHRSRSKVKK